MAVFKALVEARANLDVPDEHRNTALHTLLYRIGELQDAEGMALTIISSGRANLDIQTDNGSSALMLATERLQLKLIKALLQSQAKTDLRNVNGDTALTLAAAQHSAPISQELLAAGASVNIANTSGDTAMHLACRSLPASSSEGKATWQPDTAQVLLGQSKLRLDAVNTQGQTALTVLAATSRWWAAAVEVAAAMAANETCSFNNLDKEGFTALHYSLGAGPAGPSGLSGLGHGPDMAIHVIKAAKCDVNVVTRDKDADTALHRCGRLGLPKVCKALVSRSADANIANAEGLRPLHLAVAGSTVSHTRVAELLIGYPRCDVNITVAATGQMPLLMAVLGCKTPLVERLVKRGADPNIADKKGDTPLHAALRILGSVAMVQELVARAADLNAEDAGGCTALHHAIILDGKQPGKEFEAIALSLIEESAGESAALARMMAKDLIESGLADVNVQRASDLSSPAHFATRMAAMELLTALIARRANLGLQDSKGAVVLHLAVKAACPDNGSGLKLVQLLLESK
ncbi:hypothetical protein GPECTOR_44g12 [Gonium pectorale]|uniref:Uncharacterized protein n=1 Tax=Gonium pectorale TaxID=33097 RepID=A0A150G9A0_GONPE|nr:hypothetical protein GPECTOR_44g12 [Gonium pectorale]|eukprot:KXZ46333.1 hypothetical protein GPECTOR_44g12 [Gonium pectorale]